jgi:hypothetical protein
MLRLSAIIGLIGLLSFYANVSTAGVEFPGRQPGKARAVHHGDAFELQNDIVAGSWQLRDGSLHPIAFEDGLSQSSTNQSGTELFRLATTSTPNREPGVFVAIRLDADRVVAMASKDGVAWSDLVSFPRGEFPGEPRLVRLGKMNLSAQAKDHSDKGVPGAGEISNLSPPSAAIPSGRFAFNTGANQAAAVDCAFPAGGKMISCRIDKGTDQGMSWAPALAFVWEEGKKFLLVGVRDTHPTFNITTSAGETIKGASLINYPAFDLPASAFRVVGEPRIVSLEPDKNGVRVADRIGGKAIEADLLCDAGIHAHWRAELRDGSNYIRQSLELTSPEKTVPIFGVEFTDIHADDAKTIGTVPGCPVVTGNAFFGVEIPGSQNAISGSGAKIGFACRLQLSPAQSFSLNSVAGIAASGQLRRSFLYYVERERARPSKPFLHYNCWYDLGTGLDETKMMDVVRAFDTELVRKRGVPVMSYLADDGWDNPAKGLWVEDERKFRGGFAALSEKMKPFGAHLGVWISPMGGYGGAKERTQWARKMGLIPADGELDLSQPAYRKWFEQRCLTLMREAGVNAFKWDKAGEGVSPHFVAMLEVAHNLRKQNPDVFINVTVGTWPSPFWLNHIDSTWRMGSSDVGWAGKGDDREKWLTFRDGWCHRLFVQASPLYPLNSVMHHGIVHGRQYQGDKVGKTGANLKNEARSYFANGTSLQELYLTPSMMTPDAWDRVAEAAKWAHANADVLVDSHWVGGDPLKLEPYGYAAWNPRKGTLMIRNPDDRPTSISLDADTVFELPAGASRQFRLTSPYPDQRIQSLLMTAGPPVTVTLDPFEVLVFDATPMK